MGKRQLCQLANFSKITIAIATCLYFGYEPFAGFDRQGRSRGQLIIVGPRGGARGAGNIVEAVEAIICTEQIKYRING